MFSYIKKQRLLILIEQIGEWHYKTFSKDKLTMKHIIDKVYEEAYELKVAFYYGSQGNYIEEIADIFISLIALCIRFDIDLVKIVSHKLDIVRLRKYRFVNGKWVR